MQYDALVSNITSLSPQIRRIFDVTGRLKVNFGHFSFYFLKFGLLGDLVIFKKTVVYSLHFGVLRPIIHSADGKTDVRENKLDSFLF